MENQNETTRPGTTPEPAADGIRDTMETAANALEAQIVAADKEAQAMTLAEVAETLKATSDYHDELAGSADEEDTAQACRVQSSAIWRAAGIVEALDEARGLLSRVAELRHSNADTLADLGDEAAEILEKLEGGAL